MDIKDFLPSYPSIEENKESILNPYGGKFAESIYRKKEFYDEKLTKVEDFPEEKGMLMKHQKIIARFLSSHTMYDCLLVVHEMGTGKSCSAIGAIEQIRRENSSIDRAYIFAKGKTLLKNFIRELRDKCTAGQYIPDNFEKLTEGEQIARTRKKYEDFYSFSIGANKPTTFETFSRYISPVGDEELIDNFSNKIIVIDEVHNLRIHTGDQLEKTMYRSFHRFLHLIKNSKILLLSGTPMKDTPDEIASVMNLILPLDEQLPVGEEFIKEFLYKRGDVYGVRPDKEVILKEKFRGRVSYLKAMKSSVPKVFEGKYVGKLKHIKVKTDKMSKFQTKWYTEALLKDRKGKEGVDSNSKQASLFVFPDGSYGQEMKITGYRKTKKGRKIPIKVLNNSRGFGRYFSKSTGRKSVFKKRRTTKDEYKMSEELIGILKGDTDEKTLQNISKYSSKYASVIRSILESKDQSCFVYCRFVGGSGAILFSELLRLFNFSKATGREPRDSKRLRFGLMTADTSTSKEIDILKNRFNAKDNMYGNIIKVLVGSGVVSEGLSFSNVQQEFILTPWYNYSETAQAIARGYRLGSHRDLLESGERPVLRVTLCVSIPRNKEESIDLVMYETSEDKDLIIRMIMRLLMISSFDCSLNYFRNHVSGYDGQRECDYTDCNYVCDGIDMKMVKGGLDEKELDFSTYQLYYANPKIAPIRKTIEKMFRVNNELDVDTIVENLKDIYTKHEVLIALNAMVDEKEDSLLYKNYIETYSRSTVKKIMMGVEFLFREKFMLRLEDILNTFHKYTKFEVLTALREIINENTVIRNKYGFMSYLRESNNVYYLVNSLSTPGGYLESYYTQYPNIIVEKTFMDIFTKTQLKSLPKIIDNICNTKNKTEFYKLMKIVPKTVQEMFIEASILAREMKISRNIFTRDTILEYFENYIREIEGVKLSTLLKDEGVIRCFDKEEEKWDTCDSKYDVLIEEQEQKLKAQLEDNPYGVYGKYNPETGAFCIVDVEKQRKKENDKKRTFMAKIEKKLKDGKITEEKMKELIDDYGKNYSLVYTGSVCNQAGWSVPALLKLVIGTLAVPIPDSYKKSDSEKTLRKILETKQYVNKIGPSSAPGSKGLFSSSEIKAFSRDDLRRAIYWKNQGKKGICKAIEEFFKKRKYKGISLLVPDNQCGKSKKEKKPVAKKEKKMPFRIETLIPKDKPAKYKSYAKDMRRLFKECFGISNYSPGIDDSKWIFTFLRKKMVGFLSIDKKNIIWNVCVGEKYRRKGIAKKSIRAAIEKTCPVDPKIYVDNKGKNYTKLIRMYKSFGFTIIANDGKRTTMEFKC